MKPYEIPRKHMKSMKIDEIAASRDRAKVSLGAAFHFDSLTNSSPETYGSPKKHLQSMKIDRVAASWDRAQVSLGAAFRFNSLTTSSLEAY